MARRSGLWYQAGNYFGKSISCVRSTTVVGRNADMYCFRQKGRMPPHPMLGLPDVFLSFRYMFDSSIVGIVDVGDVRQKAQCPSSHAWPCRCLVFVGTARPTGGFCAPLQQQQQTVRGQG